MKTVVLQSSDKLLEQHGRIQLFSSATFARPSKGWSVNILPVRSTVMALHRNEMEDQALFACDDELVAVAAAGL